MADKKISELDAATTPLAGTEELAIVQGGVTKRVAASNVAAAGGLTSPVAATDGGTGLTTYAAGDVLYASATNTLAKLAAGTNGHVLKLAAGEPSWAVESVTNTDGISEVRSMTATAYAALTPKIATTLYVIVG